MLNKKLPAGISLLIFLLVVLPVVTPDFSSSEAADPKKKLSDIEKKIEEKKQQVRETIKKEKSVMENIEDISESIKKKEQELRSYDNRISQLISAKDYQDLIKKSRYISLIAHYDSKVINQFSSDIEGLVPKKQELEALNEKLNADRRATREMQKALQADRDKKDKLLASIRSKRQAYEKTIEELEESSKKLRKMIESLREKDLPKSITGKGFASLMGRLPWPVAGKVAVPFGQYKDPVFNITVFKNGIEIQPQQDEKPKAVAGGRVVYADWFKGYGLLLIIDHGSGYHSLYGNLSEIFLNTGDILIQGAVVGKIGKSELLTFPTLYFEIRHKGKPVDPVEWLERNSRASKKIRIK
ncbi:MAG: peptidoglycan DD-metalloendopeptidase family protein [Nitrospirae bacterium]|nr:peptidoglycan DD-metalloendopeptidase family protein [Nitrospirota bacterium]